MTICGANRLQDLAVIWDVDGTLVDTAELHYRAWTTLTRQLGKSFSRAQFTSTFGRRNPEIIREILGNHYTDRELAELGQRKEELYKAAARDGVTLLPGARELLEALHENRFHQAIGSSAPRANVELILQLTRTQSFFNVIVSMEDTHRGKPDPEVFQVAANRLGVAPIRCLVIEDAAAGVQAAKSGGMKCIGVRSGGQHTEESLRSAGADLVAPSLEEISVDTVKRILDL
jgi:beta-phosphoglucomutase